MEKTNNSTGRYTWLIVTMLIIFGVINNLFTIVAFLAACLYVVAIKNEDEIWCLMFALMPFANIFKMSAGSASLYTYLQLLFVVRLLCSNKLSKNFVGVYIVYVIYVLAGIGNAYSTAIKQLCIPPIFYCFVNNIKRGEGKHRYAVYFICGLLLASVIGFYKDSIPNLDKYVIFKTEKSLEGIDRFSALWLDPNYYSANLIAGLLANVFLYAKGKLNFGKFALFFVSIVIFGAMTASKTFILMLAICAVVTIVLLIMNKEYKKLALIMVFLAVSGIIVMRYTDLFDNTIARFSAADNYNDLTTNRSSLWTKYMGALDGMNLFLGNGIGAGFLNGIAAHNTYLDYLYVYGMLGSIIFLLNVFVSVGQMKCSRRLRDYLPLLAMMIVYFSLSMIYYLDFVWQLMLVVLMMLNVKGEKDNV